MIILIDLNVLLDVVLAREPWAQDAKQLFDKVAAGHYEAVIAAASVPTLFYITRKLKNLEAAFAAVDMTIASFRSIELNEAVLKQARSLAGSDFEDNIQIACSVYAGADFIVTRDRQGFVSSPIEAIETAEFLRRF